MFHYIKRLYRTWRAQKDNCFYIYDQNTHLGNLKHPMFNDMFWYEYTLEPLISDEALLSRLYDDGFWVGREISFIGNNTKQAYDFCLSIETNLFDRPQTVLLRGPYLPDNQLESKSRIK